MENNKHKVASGLFWSYGERIFAQLVSLVVSIILARLLSPENYGVISIVMIFITFCDAIVTGGFGNAIVQKKEADELDVNTMFCCSMAASVLLYALIYFAAPFIADFYQIDIICPILRILGLRMLISGMNSIQHAWIQKRMLFRQFFIATSFGTILSAVVGISLAYLGAGAWALVAQYLTNSFVDTIVLLFTSDWHPKLMFSFARAKDLLSYGWKVLLTTIVFTIEGNLRSLIIGKKFGSADLAHYDQGGRFPNLLVANVHSTITSVMFPVLSQCQDDPERLKQLTRQTIRISNYLLTPMLVGLVAVADSFICAILSEKWIPCIPYLQILTLTYLARPFANTCHQAILSVGRSDIILKIMIVINTLAIGVLLYSVFVLESVLWIAIGALAVEGVSMILFSIYGKKILSYSILEQIQDLLPTYVLSAVMGICAYLLQFLFNNELLALTLQVLFGIAFYITASWVMQLESFIYLLNILYDKISNKTVRKILLKMIRSDAS